MGIAGRVPSAIARLTVRGSHPRASAASAREMVPLFECMISEIVIEYSFSLYPSNLGCIKKHIPIPTRVQEPEITPRYTGVQHNESVSNSLQIEKTATEDGPFVFFGPKDPESKRQLCIPATFERLIWDQDRGLNLVLSCAFQDNKVAVTRICISSLPGEQISSRAIAQLGLPTMIRAVTESVVPDWSFWSLGLAKQPSVQPQEQNFAYLAQVYWLEHISHGAPRQTLMNALQMPRSTCNVLLRSIKQRFDLPASD